jgi:hypothetical protein
MNSRKPDVGLIRQVRINVSSAVLIAHRKYEIASTEGQTAMAMGQNCLFPPFTELELLRLSTKRAIKDWQTLGALLGDLEGDEGHIRQ